MSDTPARERRRWADIVVIATGLMLVGFAAWNAPASSGRHDETASLASMYVAYAVGGVLALVALFVAHRSRAGGRALLVVAAGLLLVFGFDAFREQAAAAWLTVLIPAVLLLGAAPFFGPVPRANAMR